MKQILRNWIILYFVRDLISALFNGEKKVFLLIFGRANFKFLEEEILDFIMFARGGVLVLK